MTQTTAFQHGLDSKWLEETRVRLPPEGLRRAARRNVQGLAQPVQLEAARQADQSKVKSRDILLKWAAFVMAVCVCVLPLV